MYINLCEAICPQRGFLHQIESQKQLINIMMFAPHQSATTNDVWSDDKVWSFGPPGPILSRITIDEGFAG